MWCARNKTGELRVFDFPPRRFHSGTDLSSKNTGFNDAITVEDGKDNYSFWAVQEYYNSNRIDNQGNYGYKIREEYIDEEGEKCWRTYEPNTVKNLKWEDEPVEIELIPKITPDLKRDIALEIMHDFGRRDNKTDDLIELITNKVFNKINAISYGK